MSYYIKNFLSLFSVQTKVFFENRANAIGQFVLSILDIIVAILFVEILFKFTPNISGWDRSQLLLMTGLYRVFRDILEGLFNGVYMIPEYVKNGDLDLFLTKPINTQFYISFRGISLARFLNIFAGLGLIIYSTSLMEVNLINYVMLPVGMIFGLIIFYSIFFIIATFAIWLGTLHSLWDINYIMRQPLSIPIDILTKPFSFILTFIIPLAFVITIPEKIFLGKEPGYLLLVSGVIAFILLFLSSWFWKFSLKHYTSASS